MLPRTLLYRPNVRLRYFSLAGLLEAPDPRTRQGQAAVDGGINHKTYISILELATNLRFGEVFMVNGHLNIRKVDMKFVG